jgi:Protein of unknown function (DUF3124)
VIALALIGGDRNLATPFIRFDSRRLFMPGHQRLPARKGLLALAVILLPLALYLGVQVRPSVALERHTGKDAAADAWRGELIYIPIYSSIFYENGKRTLELAATLSVHNVNPDAPITVVRADYYDTEGKLIKNYVDKPVVLTPLQTKNWVIDKSNNAGGTGANFLVQWQSQADVTSPLVEAVMMNATSNLGIAFTTSGKVIRPAKAAAK